MTEFLRRTRSIRGFLKTRLFAVTLFFVIVACIAVEICERSRAVVCMTDMTRRSLQFVLEESPLETAARFQTSADAYSIGSAAGGRYIQLTAPIMVRATVTVDGKTISCEAKNGTTVGEILHREGITYDGNDLLTPAAEKPLENGDSIVLKRVEISEYTVDETVPYKTVRKNSPLLGAGRTKTLQEGQAGAITKTYIHCTVDGKQEEMQLLGQKVARNPVEEIILVGGNDPVSPLDFGFEVDERGKPLHYKRLLTNQVATGYSARSGALTASGRTATVGTVAVNPNVIPYGSKLYITSADGNFVYGCAVAADTGTGLLQGIVDVDLFYDTYSESAMNGRKIVDIYVLE